MVIGCRVRCDFAKIVQAVVHGTLVCAAGAVASGSLREQAVFLEHVSFDSPTGTSAGHTNLSHFDLTFWGKH